MVLAPIEPSREAKLRALLDSMNEGPGRVNPNNALIPFEQFDRLHYGRLVILDDQTTGDIRVYDLEPGTYPLYLAFLGDIDGDAESFLEQLAYRAPEGLRALFSCCADFSAQSDLVRWMQEHEAPPIANYVNWHGRTVVRAREEANLHDAIESYLEANAAALADLAPHEIHQQLQQFVQDEKVGGKIDADDRRTNAVWVVDHEPAPSGWNAVALSSRAAASS